MVTNVRATPDMRPMSVSVVNNVIPVNDKNVALHIIIIINKCKIAKNNFTRLTCSANLAKSFRWQRRPWQHAD